jgi:hypothetical protein
VATTRFAWHNVKIVNHISVKVRIAISPREMIFAHCQKSRELIASLYQAPYSPKR